MKLFHRLTRSSERVIELSFEHHRYDFPTFLRVVREQIGVSRVTMAKDLDIQYLRIFHWEAGHFIHPIPEKELLQIAYYFGIETKLLRDKMLEYCLEKQSKKLFSKIKRSMVSR